MLNPGDTINNRYTVIKPLGTGAYGSVYLISDSSGSGDSLALKEMVEAELPPDERRAAVELFTREAGILQTLSHPDLPGIRDYFSVGSSHYIVMDYIDGETLEDKLKEGSEPFTWQEVLPWAAELCSILGYLHGRKPEPVIFRDLKPSNIMVTSEGSVKLIDFGIARYFNPRKVKDTYFMGTPGFSPPEQYGMGQSDDRSDIFAFGATLYRLLTKADMEQYSMKLPPLRSLAPSVPQWLETLIMKCLAVNPGERYQSVSLLLDDLQIGMVNAGMTKAGQPGAGRAVPQIGAGSAPSKTAITSVSGISLTVMVSLTVLASLCIILFMGVYCFLVYLLLTIGVLSYVGYKNGCWTKVSSFFKLQPAPAQTSSTTMKTVYSLVTLVIAIIVALCIFSKDLFGVDLWEGLNGMTGFILFFFTIIILFLLIVLSKKSLMKAAAAAIIILTILITPSYLRKMEESRYDQCSSNLRNIGTAMEMYSSDNQGRYPHNLGAITPGYMKTIPTCPAARKITYLYTRTQVPDCYTVWCQGENHRPSHEGNLPEYDANQSINEGESGD
ncbi:MAG: protein kinase [Candidatus Xenobiia bacterium LiM19]